jgi:hypothetical protein
MLVTKISCPKCKTVLRPAKPLPVGKKVKCPKCSTDFTAQESDADKPADDRNGGAASPAKAAVAKGKTKPSSANKKAEKPVAKKADAKAGPKKPDDEEEESGGTYGIVAADRPKTQEDLDREEEEGVDDEDKPGKIDYVADQSIKDLRGPAQLAINRPSNYLIANGVVGFFGWIILGIILIIPAVFPAINEPVDPNNPVIQDNKQKKKEEAKLSLYKFLGMDWRALGKPENWPWLLLSLAPVVVGVAYACVLSYGAVKMQNLESRRWAIAASCLCMFPYATGGFATVCSMFIHLVVVGLLEDPAYAATLVIAFASLEALGCLGIGIFGLVTLMRQDVIDGYEYVPDM